MLFLLLAKSNLSFDDREKILYDDYGIIVKKADIKTMHYAEDALSAERNNGIVEGILSMMKNMLDYGMSIDEILKISKIDDSLKDIVLDILKQKTDCES